MVTGDAAPRDHRDSEGNGGAVGAGDEGGSEITGASRSAVAGAGERIVRFDVWATAAFTVVSAAAAVRPDPLEYLAVPLDAALFVVGSAAFLWAYAVAVGRSRYEAVTLGGVFFLSGGVGPARVVRVLRGALAVQVVVAVAVASARPFTALAAGVLVPVLGLGLMALWGARHGHFADKAVPGDAPEVSPG